MGDDKYRALAAHATAFTTMITIPLLREYDFDVWTASGNALVVTFGGDIEHGVLGVFDTPPTGYTVRVGYRKLPDGISNMSVETIKLTCYRAVRTYDELCGVVDQVIAVMQKIAAAHAAAAAVMAEYNAAAAQMEELLGSH